jgi:N-formylglutamate deformylase
VAEACAARGGVLHINWHSMKSAGNAMTPDGPGARRPDFVVSDVRGTSADPRVTEAIVRSLRELGYSVAVNDPYIGGTIVQRIGDPRRGVHSVQVEINRALYLDEGAVEKSARFDQIAADLRVFTKAVTASKP